MLRPILAGGQGQNALRFAPALTSPAPPVLCSKHTTKEIIMQSDTQSKQTLSAADLAQFTGSEQFFRHSLNRSVLYSEGAQYLAEHAGAYWLLDEIAFAQPHHSAVANEPFQVWTLAVQPDHTATLTCDDGNGNVVFTKQIPYTDFPLDTIKLYFANDVIHLPSEY